MNESFEPLENAIRYELIIALVRREVNDVERQILALPLRHGRLGLTDPREITKTEYKHTTQIADKFSAKIYTQKFISTTTPQISNLPNTRKTEYDKKKIQKRL